MKKFTCLLLALLMCLSLLPSAAWAVGADFTIENGVLKAYNGPGGKVVIPDGVTTVMAMEQAFVNNATITEVVIPDSVTEIKTMAFYGCANLEKVQLGKGITVITDNAFSCCSKLREINIPDSVVTIEHGAFVSCASLERIVIPDSVTSIGDNAFIACTGLTQVTFGKGLTSLGPVFGNCTGLTEVVIPDNIRFLDGTFSGCSNLERVVMADTTGFSRNTFLGCEKLPDNLSDQEQYYDPTKRDPATQSDEFQVVNGTLVKYKGNTNVKTLTIPDGIIAIGGMAFVDLKELTSVDLNNVVSVEAYAFSNCPALDTVEGSAASVATLAFDGCPALNHFPNCQDQALNNRLAANVRMTAAWSGADPQIAITPQGERVTSLSNQICVGHTSDYDKVRAVYDWVAANILYDYDYYEGRKADVTIFPEDVLNTKLTVCDGYSRLTQALLQAQNIPVVRVVGQGINVVGWAPDDVDHAWNLAYAEGRWIYLDATWGSPSGGNSGRTNYDWFNPTNLNFSFTHKAEVSHIDPNGYDNDMTPHPANTAAGNFSDVSETAYYAQPVQWAVEKGITAGTSSTTFSPDTTCTTAEILTFLWRSQGQPEPSIENPFADVTAGAYYYQAALWAYERGLISGASFRGDTPCTRSATVTYLWRLAGSPSASSAAFTDVPSTADYAQAVAWAVSKDITSGTSTNTFSPEMVCSRSQIVTFLYRAYK